MESQKSEEPLRERTQEVTTKDFFYFSKLSDGTQVKTEFIVIRGRKGKARPQGQAPYHAPRQQIRPSVNKTLC